MKKHFLITFILSMAVNCGYAQDLTFKPRRILTKLTAADSLRRNSNITYFTVSPPAIEGFVLSVDQSEVEILHGPLYDGAREYYVQLPVKLTNTSADTLRYLSMSCSWWDIYRTDRQKLKVFSPNICYKNSPITCVVPPHQYIVKNVIVLVPKKTGSPVIFKMGMLVQRESDNRYDKMPWPTSFKLIRQDVIWSDYIVVSQWKTGKSEKI